MPGDKAERKQGQINLEETSFLVSIWLLFNAVYVYHVEHCLPFQFFALPEEVGMAVESELWAEVKQV